MTATDKNKDRDLKEYLAGDTDLSRAYRHLISEEPSAAVDAAVHAAAQREAKSGRRFISNPFGQQWTVPASLAAMLVISIGLVVFMSNEMGTDQYAPVILDEEITQQKLDSSVGRSGGFSDKKLPAKAKPAAVQRSKEKLSGKRTGASTGIVSKPVAPVNKRKLLRKSRARPKLETDEILRQQHLKPAPIESSAAEPKQQMEMNAPVEDAAETRLSPQEWLRQIKILRDQGKNKEADSSLAKFRKAYPDYSLDSVQQ